jgi:hypothetical protein
MKQLAPYEKAAPYTMRHKKYTTTMGCGLLTVWPGKLHSGRSALLLLVVLLLEVLFHSLHALLLSVHGHSVASLYGWTAPILARLGCTG